MRQAVRDSSELLQLLELRADQLPVAPIVDGFGLQVPRSFIRRMRKGDPADPLLRQVLPVADEHRLIPGFVTDPVGDLAASSSPGLIHKYHGRALLITTGACAIHCRYCFRRHFPYHEHALRTDHLAAAIERIAADTQLTEIILSGGDPLMLGTDRLDDLSRQLRAIPHIKRLRIHSRLPVVLPERLDQKLYHWLSQLPWPCVLVIHANHPHELDDDISMRLKHFAAISNVTLLNQSVLLRGINDDSATLCKLSERLFAAGVLPYYLHLLDKVAGTTHFEVDEITARQLHEQLRRFLPGYLVPRLVRETAGEQAKIPVL